MSKKVLIVAFIYPPLGGSGVQRTLKFSKYLPEYGWQPYVVCSDDPDVFKDGLDASLVAEIPGEARVWRRRFVNPLGLRRWVQRLLGMSVNANKNKADFSDTVEARSEGGGDEGPPQEANTQAWLYSNARASTRTTRSAAYRASLRRWLMILSSPLAAFEFPPVDAALYWALAIVPGCLRLIHREKIDLIYTSSFPYSDHLAGYLIKRLSRLYSTGIPWVADFRDPWTQNSSARNTGWRYRVDQWVEHKVLQRADRVIGVTPSYTADLFQLAQRRAVDDFMTIENGYDQADFAEIALPTLPGEANEPVEPDQGLLHPPKRILTAQDAVTAKDAGFAMTEVAHIGNIYNGTALPFFYALDTLGETGASLQVRFVGGLAPMEQAWLDNHALAAQVHVLPRQPHAAAIKAMTRADVLLLIVLSGAQRSGNYPGKLFEYMASGKPILLFGQDGDAASLIEQSGTGCFVSQEDQIGLVSLLRLLAEDPGAFYRLYYHPDPLVIAAYERRKLTSKLANVFNALIESREE